MFARTEIQGRLGTYELTMTDTDGEHTSSRRIEVAQPVKIEWGEQGREYPEQILKSRMELEVLRGAEYLRPILSGGFARRRFEVSVQGPGVDWVGFIEPESRRLPLSTKTRPQSLSLLISDDFEKAKNRVVNDNFRDAPIDDLVDESFGRSQERAYVRVDGQWQALATGDLFGTADVGSGDIRVDVSAEENAYDAMIAYLETTRGRIYRPLSEKGIVVHSLRETGQGLDAYSQEADALRPLPGEVVDVALDDLIDEEANVEDVTQAGTIKVDLEDHNLAHFGTASLEQDTASISKGGVFDSPPKLELFGPPSFTGFSELQVAPGYIDPSPSRPIGFFLSVEEDLQECEISISDQQGNFSSKTINTLTSNKIKIDAGPGPFDPIISITGELLVTIEEFNIELLDSEGNIIETLFNESSNEGVEPIETGRGAPPKGGVLEGEINSFSSDDPPSIQDTIYIPLRTYQNADLNIDADQPFLARIAIERAYRPTGIKSVEAEVFGLHGPEDLLLIDIPTGQNEIRTAPFVCGQGRSVNLTTGTTRISDVEVPADILPTNVL